MPVKLSQDYVCLDMYEMFIFFWQVAVQIFLKLMPAREAMNVKWANSKTQAFGNHGVFTGHLGAITKSISLTIISPSGKIICRHNHVSNKP